ncbi:MAG: ThuA domain-containing protein [Pirellulales bacterium]|nr:ThuA domain-containing protein [Pirellulales bacterium]
MAHDPLLRHRVCLLLAAPTAVFATACCWAAEPPTPRPRAEVEAVLAQAPGPPPDAQLRPLKIVLLADVKDHGPGEHDYPLWQKRWKVLLSGKPEAGERLQANLHGPVSRVEQNKLAAGAPNVEVSTAWQWPSAEQLVSADLLVMFCYRSGGASRVWSEERMDQLDQFLGRGGGFVVIHSATYTALKLPPDGENRRTDLTGLVFDGTIQVRHGGMAVRITAPKHPICAGLPATIQLIDEPYWPPRGDLDKVTVLATSDERLGDSGPVKPQPMFWTYQRGKGRVFGCTLGHYNWTFDDPYLRILLLRGMAWAAGESPYRFDPLVLRGAAVE